jgi:hypothetical protein
MEKNRVKMATEISKSNYADRKLRVDDDFRRDQMVVKGLLDSAKITAQYAVDVNDAEWESHNTPVGEDSGPPPIPMPPAAQQMMGQANDIAGQGPQPPISTGTGAPQ